jgi:hypothetical protein
MSERMQARREAQARARSLKQRAQPSRDGQASSGWFLGSLQPGDVTLIPERNLHRNLTPPDTIFKPRQ